MDNRDREAIEDLFRRIAEVERQSGPRDREAAALIRALIANQPSAPYYMAQTIIVQQQALDAGQARLDELEGRGAQRASDGGFLDSLFGGSARSRPSQQMGGRAYEERGPWGSGRSRMGGSMGGGGFLAGAAQTAIGVAGGVVLGNMLADYLTPDQAAAAGIDQNAGSADAGDAGDTQVADAGGDFGGGDFDVGDF